MTAPLFHLEPGALAGASAGAEVVFDGAEARHAAAAMRLAPGEAVLLADGSGTLGHGTVLAAAPDAVSVRLDAVAEEPAPTPALVL
ncbi:RNA methyltransferase PUA domain-containing protein, partial [Micrococcus luteus]